MFVQPEHAADAAKEGWNEFNPDYFHHGDGSTESERSKAAGVEKHLTPEEREQTARGGAIQSVVKAFHEDLPAHFTDELASMGLAGAAKRGWYKQAGKAITAFHGPDAPRFTAVLAAQSPRLPVGRNFTNAMHLFDAWDRAGRPQDHAEILKALRADPNVPPDVFLRSRMKNTLEALTHPDPANLVLSGPKVNSFHRNLMGNVLESTNDGWMAAAGAIDAAKFGGRRSARTGQERHISRIQRAHARSCRPRNEPARIVWCGRQVDSSRTSGNGMVMVQDRPGARNQNRQISAGTDAGGEVNDDLIRSTPDFHSLFESPELHGVVSRNPAGHARLRAAQATNTETPTNAKARASAQSALGPTSKAR